MVLLADYGSLSQHVEFARQPRSRVSAMVSGVALLAALAIVGVVALNWDQDDGSVTLAALNKQEMDDILTKAKHMSTAQLRSEVAGLEMGKVAGSQSLVTVNENTAANPDGGVMENVPATVVAPVPGPPDFNGASAVVARLPNIGFAPSLLTEKGFETRGTFTVRKSRAGESFYLRVYGKLNHNIRCTLRGYRNLMGDFTGNTIYTGFKKIYTGKSQLHTQHIPRGIVGEFDIMTCRDLGNGEVQYFRIRYD
eukprot:CAMPEP_0181315966 /NCGR_PEP_ID=MMETSP1101-20121128/15648_1 /TAXON_ID=46948 /ORGANISM="Rhodomonas abbreviata, Strain Caron Lab Isolate" /LENGTH=251 /DNA_ID=CAMNT_0023423191 /DNA_START=20 /DNA_END=775 /DNA_ORIENTATION=-